MARTLPRPRLYYMLKQQPGLLLMILDGTSKRQPGHIRQYRFIEIHAVASNRFSRRIISAIVICHIPRQRFENYLLAPQKGHLVRRAVPYRLYDGHEHH